MSMIRLQLKTLFLALIALAPFRAVAGYEALEVLVRNQQVKNDTFFFDIYLRSLDANKVNLGMADFVLRFDETRFNSPQLGMVPGSIQLYNAYGVSTNWYDSGFGYRLDTAGINAWKVLIYVNSPIYSTQNDLQNRFAQIDSNAMTHRLGTFYLTNINLVAPGDLKWVFQGPGLYTNVQHRDDATCECLNVLDSINLVNPALQAEPVSQASALTVVNKTNNSMTLNWANGSGANRMLLVKQGGTPVQNNELPVDGLLYRADSVYGFGDQTVSGVYAAYSGNGSGVTVTNLSASTTYQFALVEYNGVNGWSENYKVSSPSTTSETTEGNYIAANLKVFLQGPYNTATGLMNNHLRMGNSFGTTNLIPAAQPYNAAPFNYSGMEAVDTANHPANLVDWVMVELRSTYNGSPVANGRRAGFLLTDGSIVDTNGTTLRFWNVTEGHYYIVVKHRNHLPIMTRDSIFLSNVTPQYDFTTGQSKAYGTDTVTFNLRPQSLLIANVYGMRAGDAGGNVSWQVRYNGGGVNDRLALRTYIGVSNLSVPINNNYVRFDVNLDRQVRFNGGGLNDRIRILNYVNGAGSSSVPLVTSVPNP